MPTWVTGRVLRCHGRVYTHETAARGMVPSFPLCFPQFLMSLTEAEESGMHQIWL